ncbi:hypothetical protein Trco_000151 [Trichoderma cornu-damae]|uniref:Macro domain-containing protein n=1 Tax=Trichoderma cornu-damae TaxID=654480 RepID=A0A9P8TW23_9HYPO|nr:hypothetical protein Trco_000151 [Trichoderma cornu-damae]
MPARSSQSVADIPTVAFLYTNNYLPSPSRFTPSRPAFYPPSSAINQRVSLVRADITTLAVDAIVNAANNTLCGGGGVDGAIHAAAGRDLLQECIASYPDGCSTGSAVITGGHNLLARHVIHAVGPIYQSQAASEPLLRSCYRSSLDVAVRNGCSSIAFSGISTGIYGYPSDKAAHVACDMVRSYLQGDTEGRIRLVVFVTFLEKDVQAYRTILP